MPTRARTHRPAGGPTRQQRLRDYDRNRRDRDAKAFYDSAAWRRLREQVLRDRPSCEDCLSRQRATPATDVHHRIKRSVRPDLALDPANLMALCGPCHSRRTAKGE